MILRTASPRFDVAVFHEDDGLSGQGRTTSPAAGPGHRRSPAASRSRAPSRASCCAAPPRSRRRATCTATSARRSSATPARSSRRPNNIDQSNQPQDNSVLFPGHGDYRALVLYDQTVLPVDVAQKIATLAGEGLPIVIVGRCRTRRRRRGRLDRRDERAADAQVQSAMAQVLGIAADGRGRGRDRDRARSPPTATRRRRSRRWASCVDAAQHRLARRAARRDADPRHPPSRRRRTDSAHRLLPAAESEPDGHRVSRRSRWWATARPTC